MTRIAHTALTIIFVLCSLVACQRDHVRIPPGSSEAITPYLVKRVGFTSIGGQVFCAYEPLADINRRGDQVEIYLWVLCQEYTWHGESLEAGSGTSLPVVLTLAQSNGTYQVVADSIHGEVGPSEEQVRASYPRSAWASILPKSEQEIIEFNARIARLESLLLEQALAAFTSGSE